MVEDRPEAGTPVDLVAMMDLATPWCLHVAATLRIPDHISASRKAIAELAEAVGCGQSRNSGIPIIVCT